ncbi:SDR family NAD(P)-dependent oxidoreductase [Spongiibacter sp. KMU-166]|uniref:SDR family NAD(P)-dependent oxidoreductase n=1 Tax=Spongiibacter thalassae TaxID=2721624 RepID=A0ABX1GBJ7_9GAMM|nr:SDR family NAD(P)-dependent oxidoreductase [Spongiibacter thalassae]NKI15858.1 SDR family NAD(P)-dependent oxidoreductase [Spongiibacter thalassae]
MTINNKGSINTRIDLTGQIAMVTGASSGLGWQFARVLAAAGAKVIATGRRENKLRELEAVIRQDGGECQSVLMDMTDAENIMNAVDKAEVVFGRLTILVNNAGIPDSQLAMKMPVELIDRVLDTNLRGPFILSCEVARRFKSAGIHGRITNIASVAAYNYGGGGAALYSITKGAVVRMTEVLAVEWARFHINVNAIAPGTFHSEMTDGMLARVGDVSGNFPRNRICEPSQLDSTLLYLCAPASDCVTGTVIRVDDGQVAR